MINYQTQATREANNREAARIMAEHGNKVPVGSNRTTDAGTDALNREYDRLYGARVRG